jgi:hypothetical protein
MDFLYRFQGPRPPEEGRSMGRWGFNVFLDGNFARKALQSPFSQKHYGILQSRGREVIVNCGWKPEAVSRDPFNFYDVNGDDSRNLRNPSRLLHYCQVPGNACGLSFDCSGLPNLKEDAENIEYVCDNVDSMNQSMALIALWTTWLDFIEAGFLLEKT